MTVTVESTEVSAANENTIEEGGHEGMSNDDADVRKSVVYGLSE